MKDGITLPSLSNDATQFNLGGTMPYGDVLFTAGLIGQNSTQLKDSDHTLLPTLHNFTYDTDFYVTNVAVTQALEFDIVLQMNGISMFWGIQCAPLGDGDWDYVDNTTLKWVSTGNPCKLANGWNHLTLQFQREADNSVRYESITLDGVLTPLNITSPAGVAPASWWGLAANFQMDGNSKQAANTVYLDNLSVTYQ